ncbi:MAG: [FeFe] hydrogenase H-cluster radical SAM maturase HydG [Candidatus Peribacteraceae bacterium]
MPTITDVVDEGQIFSLLRRSKHPSRRCIEGILSKAMAMRGLTLEEIGSLLFIEDAGLLKKLFETAWRIKMAIYGERLVFFAPLYLSSYCVNDCEYCAFHCRNPAPRKKLTMEELREQTKILIDMGHKRLLLEFGEHPEKNPIDYVVESIKTIYATKSKKGEIRRVNVNIAATTVEDYRKLKAAGIGTYQLFQETYHRDTYAKLHHGPKADYERQLFAHTRAFAAGIDDVGLGVLFGLYDYRFEVLAMVSHAQYLDRTYNIGPHTFSVPRFQPADTVQFDMPYRVSQQELLRIIAILRVSVPYTGMIISTRERPETRAQAFKIGISQTSAASRTSPGAYGQDDKELEQFTIADHRTLDDVVMSIMKQGLLPSFCTACYRKGRTGEIFMKLAKPGEIHHLCRPNGILTFKEYLEDYASPEVKKAGEKTIQKYLKQIASKERHAETLRRLERIKAGERDLYF